MYVLESKRKFVQSYAWHHVLSLARSFCVLTCICKQEKIFVDMDDEYDIHKIKRNLTIGANDVVFVVIITHPKFKVERELHCIYIH